MKQKYVLLTMSIILGSVLVLGVDQACARDGGERNHSGSRVESGRHFDGGRHFDRDNHYPFFGLRFSFLPRTYYSLYVGGAGYYYLDGTYYIRERGDYVVVNPPVGAIVRAIPDYYQPVVINGMTYYMNNGVYYLYTTQGYQVVPQPQQVFMQPAALMSQPVVQPVVPSSAPANSSDVFTVNIPNAQGNYTPVIIKRASTGNGFVGPQGEFYSEFPKVEQLKEMYGK
ncbi:MAG: hypothetical protein HQL26_05705 [Candidatus Omnitrophica bacterium]|nr:hypothetical protein [Candidatus Omnitrophota bacterium]